MNSAYVLSDGMTATTDYFLFPYLRAHGYLPKLINSTQTPEVSFRTAPLVVVSRYLPPLWRKTLYDMKQHGAKLVYFMDDDLLDFAVLYGLPWRYRWKILRLAIMQKATLIRMCDEIWVSSDYLVEKYAELRPHLIPASPTAELIHSGSMKVRICYHASASHQSEMQWLAKVVKLVQSESDNTHFELFGGDEIRHLYRGLPRVSILHPMKWSDYLSWSGMTSRDIALAPLLPAAFNRARSPTKFFDYARLGAAGIYTNSPPYAGYVRDGIDGLLLDNDPQWWADAILALASNEGRRRDIAEAARIRLLGEEQPLKSAYVA